MGSMNKAVLPSASAKNFPVGSRVLLATLADNPYPLFHDLQAHESVSWIEEIGLWFVTRRADVLAILNDPDTFTVVSERSLMAEAMGEMMLSMDGERQARMRRPFATHFAPKAVRTLAIPLIETNAHRLIDEFIAQRQIDLDAAFSEPLALLIVTGVLGLPVEDAAQMQTWVNAFAATMGNYRLCRRVHGIRRAQ